MHNYNIFLHFQDIVRIKKFCNNLLRLKLLHVLESPTNLSSKATKTKERENISNSIFISMSMRCGSAKIFCNESCTLCDQFSQFEKILCMSKTCFYYLVSLFCMCGLQCHTYKNSCNVRIALFEISAYHKIIQANGALNLGLFELKIKLLTYYYLQIIKIGLFVDLQTQISVSYKFIVIFKFSCI